MFKSFGESVLLIEWPTRIDEAILYDILNLKTSLQKDDSLGIIETINAYNSLTVIFNNELIFIQSLIEKIQIHYDRMNQVLPEVKKLWKIPVCYEPEYGIDLAEVAHQKKMEPSKIVSLHCGQTYTIYFLGFLPGFLYLGGLPTVLHTPRRNTPRAKITKGAVAIGGAQTGIYPSESPGGWNIIGNSPIQFFDPLLNPPCFAEAGDQLMFYTIDRSRHQQIADLTAKGLFEIEFEMI